MIDYKTNDLKKVEIEEIAIQDRRCAECNYLNKEILINFICKNCGKHNVDGKIIKEVIIDTKQKEIINERE